jgi:hypothetical protein
MIAMTDLTPVAAAYLLHARALSSEKKMFWFGLIGVIFRYSASPPYLARARQCTQTLTSARWHTRVRT